MQFPQRAGHGSRTINTIKKTSVISTSEPNEKFLNEKQEAILKIASDEYALVKQIALINQEVDAFIAILEKNGFSILENRYYGSGSASIFASVPATEHWGKTVLTSGKDNVLKIGVYFDYSVTGWNNPVNTDHGDLRKQETVDDDERVILNTLKRIFSWELIECTFHSEDESDYNDHSHEHYAIIVQHPHFIIKMHKSRANRD